MVEELRRLKPGDRLDGIPAPTWNAFVDAVEYVRRLRRSLSADPLRDVPQTGIVRLKNASGLACNRFDVLGISDVFPQPSQNLSAFKSGPVLHGVCYDHDSAGARVPPQEQGENHPQNADDERTRPWRTSSLSRVLIPHTKGS